MSARYTRDVTLVIPVRDLADMFVSLSSNEQAEFFEQIAEAMAKWGAHDRDAQMLYLAKEMKRGGPGAEWVAALAEEVER